MVPSNVLREKLESGEFVHLVELGSGPGSRNSLDRSVRELSGLDAITAVGIPSRPGHAQSETLETATVVRDAGLVPNVHFPCFRGDRRALRKRLEELDAVGIHNVLAITGDYPSDEDVEPTFDLDSVTLVEMIARMRRAGMPFHISVAVSPFKYSEADCVYQYIKLEKKFRAGADFAITQVGHDVRKFAELLRYLADHRIEKPVIGSVAVLSVSMARTMAQGSIPGCWVSPRLLERIEAEADAPDGGREAALERAARTVAVLRGLGYAGAYIAGARDRGEIETIVRRGEGWVADWQEAARELTYSPMGAFYLHGPQELAPPPVSLVARMLNRVRRNFPVRPGSVWRTMCGRAARWAEARPGTPAMVRKIEEAVKRPLFGCTSCGNCVLEDLEYVCPQTCPKQIRNGPCGGASAGTCEVGGRRCVWVDVYERARAGNELELLRVYVPPPDRSLEGTSSWMNDLLGRDSRPGYPKEMGRDSRPGYPKDIG
jgi:methylenetetrahydrofolate reductase (NADPH)